MFSNHTHILNFWSVLSHHKFIEMQHFATFIDWWAIIQPTTISNILFHSSQWIILLLCIETM